MKVTQYKTGKASLYAQGKNERCEALRPARQQHCSQGGQKRVLVVRVGMQFTDSLFASIIVGKRRYDRKQSGYGGQTKPVFHKKVRTQPATAHILLSSIEPAHTSVPGDSTAEG